VLIGDYEGDYDDDEYYDDYVPPVHIVTHSLGVMVDQSHIFLADHRLQVAPLVISLVPMELDQV
jgi:hypothetical protein